MVNSFKALHSVLSQTKDVICDVYGISTDEAFKRTEDFIKENSSQWKQENPTINYSDPFCRMAYLYMNVTVHANLVERAFYSFPQIKSLIRDKVEKGQDLKICALGGGPGSELLGVVQFIRDLQVPNSQAQVDFALIDRITEWDESWHALKSGVDDELRSEFGNNRSTWPMVISRSFLRLDVTSAQDFTHFATRFSDVDIFLLCYIVSEVKENNTKFSEVMSFLAERAKPGSYFLFIDRDERVVRELVETTISMQSSLENLGVIKERGKSSENLHDLGEWYINIEPLPRQNWLAFFAAAVKVSVETNLPINNHNYPS